MGRHAAERFAAGAAGLQISAPTVHRHIDLLEELLLVRWLPPFLRNVGKRLVKSPKIYVRDSGLVHALLGIRKHNDLAGHPVAGVPGEGFVVENLLQAVSGRTVASFSVPRLERRSTSCWRFPAIACGP
jgi:predicted AAA+ superfamily ATPase